MKTLDLCMRCAAELEPGYRLTKLPRGVDQKVTCASCGRRRYGATYQVELKKPEATDEGQV